MGHTLKDGFEMLNPTVQIFQTFDGSEEFV
jgi:hypothetical protein